MSEEDLESWTWAETCEDDLGDCSDWGTVSSYDISGGAAHCPLELFASMLSLRAASIYSPSSSFISDGVILTVELDLDNGGVRHGGEIPVDLTSLACYRFHYHHIFHWLTLIHNWLSDGEIKSLIHLGEYHHLCIQSTISEPPTIWQSGPSETHQRKQVYSQHIGV